MSDLDKALSQAAKVIARNSAAAPEAKHEKAGRRSTLILLGGIIAVAGMIGAYAFWLSLSNAKNEHRTQAIVSQKSAITPPVAAPVAPPVPTSAPAIPDPMLAQALDQMTLNAILSDPPRIQMNGKIFAIGSEILPGLTLKSVDRRTLIAEDSAGVLYRRTF